MSPGGSLSRLPLIFCLAHSATAFSGFPQTRCNLVLMVCRLLTRTHVLAGCVLFTLPGLVPAQTPANPSTAAATPSLSTRPDFSHARTLMQQGKIDEAIAELQSIEAAAPNTRGLALELGTAYYKKSDYVKAVDFLKRAVADDPNSNEATQLLGLSYYLNGYPGQAIPYLEKVQAWFPRANVDASYILGVCYIKTKNYPLARKAFAR